jgi:hypothetical protein
MFSRIQGDSLLLAGRFEDVEDTENIEKMIGIFRGTPPGSCCARRSHPALIEFSSGRDENGKRPERWGGSWPSLARFPSG